MFFLYLSTKENIINIAKLTSIFNVFIDIIHSFHTLCIKVVYNTRYCLYFVINFLKIIFYPWAPIFG